MYKSQNGFEIEQRYVKECNVNLYLHKPLPDKKYKSIKDKIADILRLDLLEQHVQVHNDVVDAGEIWIAELLANKANTDAALPSWLASGLQGSGGDQAVIAVGTGGIATDQNDVDLTTFLDDKYLLIYRANL